MGLLGLSWALGLLGSWGALGALSGALGALLGSWGPLGPLLGPSWALGLLGHLGAILRPQKPIGGENGRGPTTLIPRVLRGVLVFPHMLSGGFVFSRPTSHPRLLLLLFPLLLLQDSTAHLSSHTAHTAQPSTAQHSAAHRSTAHHITAQHSTVQQITSGGIFSTPSGVRRGWSLRAAAMRYARRWSRA